jgi:hypothetical protein
MNENWKRYKDTNYEVSDLGNVRSLNTGAVMRASVDERGYPKITAWASNVPSNLRVHRMVAEMFLPNLEGKPVVNHLDGVKTNNCLTNLEWATVAENTQHAYDTGLQGRGEDHHLAKLVEDDVHEIRQLIATGMSATAIGAKFGVTMHAVLHIRDGKAWAHVPVRALAPLVRSGRLMAADIPLIRQLFLDGKCDRFIADIYGVSKSSINKVRCGKTWYNY